MYSIVEPRFATNPLVHPSRIGLIHTAERDPKNVIVVIADMARSDPPLSSAFVAEFVDAVKRRFPNALLQWEDFKKGNAFELLHRFQDEILSFNDDIQGTAAVALAGIMGGSRASGVPMNEQRIVILGAGAAGIGIGNQVRDALHRSGLDGDDLTLEDPHVGDSDGA